MRASPAPRASGPRVSAEERLAVEEMDGVLLVVLDPERRRSTPPVGLLSFTASPRRL